MDRTTSLDTTLMRDPALGRELLDKLAHALEGRRVRIMEVCGTHTVAIARAGLRQLMPEGLDLISGPGCPVCVTANESIDTIIALARRENMITTTFGDMMRVPGSTTSLNEQKAEGADIRVVYSPLDALEIARNNPRKDVFFAGVGFETTVPLIAAAIEMAEQTQLENFSVYSAHKTMPHAIEAIVNDPDVSVNGLMLPGHVSTIIGLKPYQFLSERYHIPGVITGFEIVDILQGILMLAEQVVHDTARIENAYPRGVNPEGNPTAQELVHQFFEPCDATWRGLGLIPQSGLAIRPEYAAFDASARFAPVPEPTIEHAGCRCGDVLRGVLAPHECALFGTACTPENPIGACMVSSEGSCAAHFRYGNNTK